MVEKAEVYTKKEKTAADEIRQGGKKEAEKKLFGVLENIFVKLKLKEADKLLGNIKDKKADPDYEFSREDVGSVRRLERYVKAETNRISGRVGKIEEIYGSGDVENARKEALRVLREEGSDLSVEQRKELESLAKRVFELMPESDELDNTRAFGILKIENNKNANIVEDQAELFRGMRGVREEYELRKTGEEIGEIEKTFREEGERRKEKKIDKGKVGDVKDKLKTIVDADRAGVLSESERRVVGELSVLEMQDFERAYASMSSESKQKVIDGIWGLEQKLEGIRKKTLLSKISKGGRDKSKVIIEAAGQSIEVGVSGNRRDRLEAILPYISGEGVEKELEVKYIAEACLVDVGEAEKIWNWANKWHKEISPLEKQIEGWRQAEFLKLLDERVKEVEQESLSGAFGQGIPGRGVRFENNVSGWNNDGEPILTSEAEDRQSWIGDLDSVNGANMTERMINSLSGRLDPRMASRSRFNYEGLSSEMATTRAEEVVKKIMRTEESSRDPKNQMLAWELFDILSAENIPASVREKWAVQLALYDVGTMMGSVNSYEDWSRVSGFLWKEAWAVLESEKEILFYDSNGDAVDLGFKDIQTLLELGVRDNSGKEVWFGHMMKANNLADLELRKRQFMSYVLAKKLGFNIQINVEGDLVFGQNAISVMNERLGSGREAFMRMVGLSEDGKKVLTKSPDIQGEGSLYDQNYSPEQDVYNNYAWFVNNVITHSHMTLRSVEIERGGSDGKFWKYMPNVLRKLHGNGTYHYFHQKHMGLNPFMKVMEVLDCRWRSLFSWRADQGKGAFTNDLMETLRGGLRDKSKAKNIYSWMEKSIMSSDNERLDNGYILTVNEIRERSGKARSYYEKMSRSDSELNDFDWRDVLISKLGMKEEDIVGSTVGASGAELFIKNFSFDVYNYDSINPSDIADHVKYTGLAYEYFGNVLKFVNYPSLSNMKALFDIYSGYHGTGISMEKVFDGIMRQYQKFSESGLSYETFMQKNGNEGSEAEKTYDENGNVEYRRGKRYWIADVLNPNKKAGLSPAQRRGFRNETWYNKKLEIEQALKMGIYGPEEYMKYKRRFKAKLWTGIDWKEDEGLVRAVTRNYLRNPLKLAFLPANVVRGMLVDWFSVEWSDKDKLIEAMMGEMGGVAKYIFS